jgi:hypothetical protein
MSTYSLKGVQNLVETFQTTKEGMADVVVEILPEENHVSNLLLLRTFNGEKSLDDIIGLTSAFIKNRQVTFKKGETILYSFIYGGEGALAEIFPRDKVWLLDLLINTTYMLMIKKLMPPSLDTIGEGGKQDLLSKSKKET